MKNILQGLLLIGFIMLSSGSAIAQKKLHFIVDKSSGDTTWYGATRQLYLKAGRSPAIGEKLTSTIYRTGERYSLAFDIQTGRTNNYSISAGSIAVITLQDGAEIGVEKSTNDIARSSLLGYGSTLYAFYRISQRDLALLASSPIVSVRIPFSSGYMDWPIPAKNSDVIQEQIKRMQP
jgi:hypothetical protein